MASNPPGECCTKGSLHEGDPTGEMKEFAGVDTYFAYPPSKSTDKVILILTDIIGIWNNSKLIADLFAAHGYFVVMPDILDKDPAPLSRGGPKPFNLGDWLAQPNHRPEFIQAVVDKTLAHIQDEFKPKKIGGVGYCLGGRYVTRLLDGRIDAGYNAHPSLVTMEELAAIKRPLSISAAEVDTIFTREQRHQSEAKLAEIEATYQIFLYGGVEHGFAVRGDIKDPKQRLAREQAFSQAIAWFKEYLK